MTRAQEIKDTAQALKANGLDPRMAEMTVAMLHGESTGDYVRIDEREQADIAERVKRHAGIRDEPAP